MKIIGVIPIFFLHLLILSRLTFTAWPEMFSYPYLFINGFTLYKDFIMPYPPGLILFLSGVFHLFGFTAVVLKISTWILILATDLFIYLNIQKITKNHLTSSLLLGAFIFLQSFFEGNMLWFDFATVLPLLLGFYFWQLWFEGRQMKHLFFASLFLSLATFVKQVALVYLLAWNTFYFFTVKRNVFIRGMWAILLGMAAIFIPLVVYIFFKNSAIEFWQWVFLFPLTEWSKYPGYVNFVITKRYLLIMLLLFSPVFLSAFFWRKLIKDKTFLLCLTFLISALIVVYPRFSFFHLQPVAAFLVIIYAKILTVIPKNTKFFYLSAVFLITGYVVSTLSRFSVGDQIRFYSVLDLKMGKTIADEVKSGGKVFMLGVNSSEYVFSGRLPPKRWSDNFGWYLEIPGVQSWVIEGLKTDPPAKVLWRLPEKGKGFEPGVYQPQQITDYIRTNFKETGKIEEDIQIWTKKD